MAIATRRWLTATEIAEQLAVSASTIYRLANRDKIPELRVGRSRRFVLADVEAALSRMSQMSQDNEGGA